MIPLFNTLPAGRTWLAVAAAVVWFSAPALAQNAERIVAGDAETPIAVAAGSGHASPLDQPSADLLQTLLPALDAKWLAWIAAVMILVLTFQSRPTFTLRNLDAKVLAITCVLWLARADVGVLGFDPSGATVQWWAYLAMTVCAGYWVLRGLMLLFARDVSALVPNISDRGQTLIVIAAVGIVMAHLATAPLSGGATDGLMGGLYTAETGKLPYGDVPGHDARSPLLYLAFAGANQVVSPKYDEPDADSLVPMTWDNRDQWVTTTWWSDGDMIPARIVNAVLFLLVFAGLAGIGHRLHSVGLGLTLAAILCLHPGVLECLSMPEIMLPVALLTWSVAFINVPIVGGFGSLLCLVLAGLAWPWAWLVLPVMGGYWLARGWRAFGAVVGGLGGLAAIIAGLLLLVLPSLPRSDGAVRQAGLQPAYTASLSEDGAIVVQRHETNDQIEGDFKSWLWKFLLNHDTATLGGIGVPAALPPDVIAEQVTLQRLAAHGPVAEELQPAYRAVVAEQGHLDRLRAASRTMLESTWIPAWEREQPQPGTWALWAAQDSDLPWIWIRRIAKIAVGLLGAFVGVVLLRKRDVQRHQLIGGLLAVTTAILIVSESGAVANLVWVMPLVLAGFATRSDSDEAPMYVANGPRITVNR
jgi:hypothetical protein